MRTFYVVRHAQSLGNAGVPGAGPNPGLSDLGRSQAQALAQHIASKGSVAEIWSSPFARAVQTSAAVADAASTRIRLEPGLHEYFFAGWFDLATLRLPSLAEVAATHPRIESDEDDDHWWPVVDEDELALERRLAEVAARLLEQALPGVTVLVGHGASVAALAYALTPDFQPSIAVVENASITEICCERERCALVRFNDTRHWAGH